jgi:hypothetical protein
VHAQVTNPCLTMNGSKYTQTHAGSVSNTNLTLAEKYECTHTRGFQAHPIVTDGEYEGDIIVETWR